MAYQHEQMIRLREELEARLSSSELRTLSFDMEVDYDNLSGETKADKVRELIVYLARRQKIKELVLRIQQTRSDIVVGEISESVDKPIEFDITRDLQNRIHLPEFQWAEDSKMILLPRYFDSGTAVAVSKHLVTNAQYRLFVDEIGGSEPVGEHFIDGSWQGPFYPWQDKDFNDPLQPVVCVAWRDVERYCRWASNRIRRLNESRIADSDNQKLYPRASTKPLLVSYWNIATFDQQYPPKDPRDWLSYARDFHHNAEAPAKIDLTGVRSNPWGFSDLIGNVWEWCSRESPRPMLSAGGPRDQEVRGGGFLDDLFSPVEFILSTALLRNGLETRHSDLGFRIAAEIYEADLPPDLRIYFSMIHRYHGRR
jgi:hypothetical protein